MHVGAPSEGVIAVIKGLGYGTDPVLLGRLLEAQNVDWLAVAYADEGVVLREAGIQCNGSSYSIPTHRPRNTMHAHDSSLNWCRLRMCDGQRMGRCQ